MKKIYNYLFYITLLLNLNYSLSKEKEIVSNRIHSNRIHSNDDNNGGGGGSIDEDFDNKLIKIADKQQKLGNQLLKYDADPFLVAFYKLYDYVDVLYGVNISYIYKEAMKNDMGVKFNRFFVYDSDLYKCKFQESFKLLPNSTNLLVNVLGNAYNYAKSKIIYPVDPTIILPRRRRAAQQGIYQREMKNLQEDLYLRQYDHRDLMKTIFNSSSRPRPSFENQKYNFPTISNISVILNPNITQKQIEDVTNPPETTLRRKKRSFDYYSSSSSSFSSSSLYDTFSYPAYLFYIDQVLFAYNVNLKEKVVNRIEVEEAENEVDELRLSDFNKFIENFKPILKKDYENNKQLIVQNDSQANLQLYHSGNGKLCALKQIIIALREYLQSNFYKK